MSLSSEALAHVKTDIPNIKYFKNIFFCIRNIDALEALLACKF